MITLAEKHKRGIVFFCTDNFMLVEGNIHVKKQGIAEEGVYMFRIRPYKSTDADTILSWCKDEKAFYQWTAGVLGDYPITQNEFKFVESLMPFTAFDETGIIGFLTLRNPNEAANELRFGFVTIKPDKRGKGYGKAMLRLGLKFVFELYCAKKATLGVFENNPSAYYCYKAVGFHDIVRDIAETETYNVLGEEWKCKEMEIKSNL